MKHFSHFPFHLENEFSPLACKLRKVWADIEAEAAATNLDVLFNTTRSDGYSQTHFPFYCFASNRLTVDFTRGYSETLAQLVLGLGMHHYRWLFNTGARNPYAEVWAEAEAWAKAYSATLDSGTPWPCSHPSPAPVLPLRQTGRRRRPKAGPLLPPQPLKCVAFLFGGRPCPEPREPGKAFCRAHQHYRLHGLGEIVSKFQNEEDR